KLDHAKTGDTLSDGQQPHAPVAKVVPHPPVLSIAVVAKERKDDVKLGHALAKLLEEDPSISVVHNPEAHEVVLWGQGEMQLRVGSDHAVEYSDMAFQLAGRLAIHDGRTQCQPVLLEPIYQVEIVCPSEATAKMNALMSGRRGQILGFDTREGWDGWDVVRVQMPESEIGDLIVEVRSATAGVGSFTFKFDHMAEVTGRTADQIVAARKAAAA